MDIFKCISVNDHIWFVLTEITNSKQKKLWESFLDENWLKVVQFDTFFAAQISLPKIPIWKDPGDCHDEIGSVFCHCFSST